MNSHDKTYRPSFSPFDPCPPIKTQTYSTPPHFYMGNQPPNFLPSTPEEARRAGTLWKPLSVPYYHPHQPAWGHNPAWHPCRVQRLLPYALAVNPPFARNEEEAVSRFRLRKQGMRPETAYQIIHDEIVKDGNARLNLATFVTTWMESTANRLYAESVNKNLIDKDEYPQTAAIEERCVRILANLWHSPGPHNTMGVSTAGSSEGCMLGGLALKRRWQNARKKQGKPTDRPNIVFSSAVQVVWKKFANYWDVEPRYVNITPDHPYMGPEGVLAAVDENTIGVIPTLGVTYTGLYEPVAAISTALDELQSRTGLDIPIHVDAASGGFVAPFLQPDIVWDFQLPRVKSINVSGHKYGLVYPGIGWIIWREANDLPEELIFRVSYLGGNMPTFGLNFSRPSSQVLLQYYNFLRLGKDGYYQVQKASQAVAHFLAKALQSMGPFELFTDGSDIPVLSWRLKEGYTSNWDLYDLSRQLRTFGWQVPAYPLPPSMETVTIMRVVVRNGFSMEMAQFFLMNLMQAVSFLDSVNKPLQHNTKDNNGFHH
ncbi:glutamate decarboxylase [Bacillus sp. EB600]|uniref:glutamate decarboxylase n=1 Tax=Bacillus sp. EB600 TaxID=2806345 RepID=UPI002108E1ED|nr:glutamate decarboxylase [Bacillus sp. EB600]MCQ6281337.1 glutamate decarboxylase [Bacillus sp. EB600]